MPPKASTFPPFSALCYAQLSSQILSSLDFRKPASYLPWCLWVPWGTRADKKREKAENTEDDSFWHRHVTTVIRKTRNVSKDRKAGLSRSQPKLWRRARAQGTARLLCDPLGRRQREWPGTAGGISCEKCFPFQRPERLYAVEQWSNYISASSVPKWRELKDWHGFLFPSSEQGLDGSISLSGGKASARKAQFLC